MLPLYPLVKNVGIQMLIGTCVCMSLHSSLFSPHVMSSMLPLPSGCLPLAKRHTTSTTLSAIRLGPSSLHLVFSFVRYCNVRQDFHAVSRSVVAALQGSSPSAVQRSSPSTRQAHLPDAQQTSTATVQNANDESIVITADRHQTYSESDLAEMETGVHPLSSLRPSAKFNTHGMLTAALLLVSSNV